MNYSTSIVGTTFVESLLWPPTAFLQTLWEQPFPQSLWERYTLTNHAISHGFHRQRGFNLPRKSRVKSQLIL